MRIQSHHLAIDAQFGGGEEFLVNIVRNVLFHQASSLHDKNPF